MCFSLSDLLQVNTFFRVQKKIHHLFNIFTLQTWRRKWQPTPVFLPEEFHGQRRLLSYNPWGHKELDTTMWLTHTLCKPSITISTNSRGCLNTELALAQCSSYNKSQNNNSSCSTMNHLLGKSCWLTGYLKSPAGTKWNVGFLFCNRSWIGLLMSETLAHLRTLSPALFHVFSVSIQEIQQILIRILTVGAKG